MKYAYPVRKMCTWLHVSASGFFDWKRRPQSATAARRAELTTLIKAIFTDSDETYGYRRVHAELARRGVPAGPELVRARRTLPALSRSLPSRESRTPIPSQTY